MSDQQQDPLEERLRAALTATAEEVEPRGDGLSNIRGRISERQKRSWAYRLRAQWLARPAFAAAASMGVIALGLTAAVGIGQVSAGNGPFGFGDKASSSSSADASSSKSAKPTASKTSKSDDPTGSGGSEGTKGPKITMATVPVYHVVKTEGGYDVAPSSAQVKIKGDDEVQEQRAEGAIRSIFSNLSSTGGGVWNSGTAYDDVDLEGSTLKVMLTSAANSGAVNTAEAARAALKQLVLTGLEAAPSASSVQVLAGGQPVTSFWGILQLDAGGVQPGASALTESFNEITAPQEGSINLSSITLKGHGAYDNQQVGWRLMKDGAAVKSGTVSTGTNGFTDWSTTIEADPGSYKLETYEPTDGGEAHVRSVNVSISE